MSNKFQNEDFKSSSELVAAGGTAAQLLNTTKIWTPKSASTLELVLRKNNDAGTIAPGLTDDSSSGYEPGSRWLDTVALKIYTCISNGVGAAVWKEGGSSAGTGVSDLDVFLSQSFDSAILGDFTQTGLVLDTTSPLDGTTSAKLIHQAATSQSFKQTKAVPQKFRGQPMTVAVVAKSNATIGNVTILFRDETNNLVLQTSSQIQATSTIQTFQFGVTIPSNCLSFSYTITALQEAGSPITYIDDIVITNYWMGTSAQGQTTLAVPSIQQQASRIFNSVATGTNVTIIGALTTTSGSGLYSYNAGTGLYTVLKAGYFDLSFATQATGANVVQAVIIINSDAVVGTNDAASAGTWGCAAVQLQLNVGDTFFFSNNSGISQTYRGSVAATAVTTSNIVTTDLVPAKALNGSASILVPKVTQQGSLLSQSVTFGNANITGSLTSTQGSGVYTYNQATGVYTLLKDAEVTMTFGAGAAGNAFVETSIVDGTNSTTFDLTTSTSVSGAWASTAITGKYLAGQTFMARNTSPNNTNIQRISFAATAVETETKTWSSTQTLVIDNPSSILRLGTANGYGSTGTKIRRFSNIVESIGADVQYNSSSVNGDSFTILKDGDYAISYTFTNDTGGDVSGISKNASSLSADITTLAQTERLASDAQGAGTEGNASWSGPLKVGDIIRAHSANALVNSVRASREMFSIAKTSAAKALNTVSDQKIELSTHELRFEGAAARGSTNTAIVRFDTIAKLKGDAFSIVSDAANGTAITILKKGKLDIGASLYPAAASIIGISLNQTTLTSSSPPNSQVLATDGAQGANETAGLNWSGSVNVGDVLRIFSNVSPTNGTTTNSLNLFLQEQTVAVSVSNTLPQYSESDSAVRVSNANGFGSTSTLIRRYSNVEDNAGVDISYADSATLGASFTILSDGVYAISIGDNFTSNGNAYIGVSRNSNSGSTPVYSLVQSERLLADYLATATAFVTAAWTGRLNKGDVIRPHFGAALTSQSAAAAYFSITKIGKPNVTGVNITPFVNIPLPVFQYARLSTFSASAPSTDAAICYFVNTDYNTNNGLFRIDTDAVNGTRITALKKISISGLWTGAFVTAQGMGWSLNSSQLSTNIDSISTINRLSTTPATASGRTTANLSSIVMSAGDVLRPHNGATGSRAGTPSEYFLSVTAEAVSDNILTEPDTFNSESAGLVFSNAYTLTTLKDAPVGTFLTFQYPINSNTKTQNTTAPNQSISDMNANGFFITARPFATASGSGTFISTIAVQIGKGMKGVDLRLFGATGKSTPLQVDPFVQNSTTQLGVPNTYDPLTGILTIDPGLCYLTTITANVFKNIANDSSQTTGYIFVNASKNPALIGLNTSRIAARGVSTSGQSIANNTFVAMTLDAVKTFDSTGSLNAATGVFTALESGYYQVNAASSTSGSFAANTFWNTYIYKNGVVYTAGNRQYTITAGTMDVISVAADVVFLAKGDTVQPYILQGSGSTKTLLTVATNNYFSVIKIGN